MEHRNLQEAPTSKLTMTPTAIKLYIKEGTTLDLAFLEGCVKRYDALSLSDKFPQLLALKDRKLFVKGRLMGFGGVVWNDDLDIDSETIYEEGADVTEEYPDLPLCQLGYRIRQARLEKEMSQEELSSASGIQQADISRIEKGSANPSVKTLMRIANALGAPLLISLSPA